MQPDAMQDWPGLVMTAASGEPAADSGLLPPTWPPPDDFVVVRDADGNPVSRYSDPFWDLSPWHGSPLRVSFGDGPKLNYKGRRLSTENSDILRRVAAYLLYGPGYNYAPKALETILAPLKRWLAFCSEKRVAASDSHRHPRVLEDYLETYNTISSEQHGVTLFHRLWADRELLGITLLTPEAIKQLAAANTTRSSIQHAYIPPRIWEYQNLRLRECLDDFIALKDAIRACLDFIYDAYLHNYGAADKVFSATGRQWPFRHRGLHSPGKISGCRFYDLRETLSQFGILDVVSKWVELKGLPSLNGYLTLVSRAGLAYILNFSLMRISEGYALPYDCWREERDELGDDISLIASATTKSQTDDDALWIVSPSCRVAIEAMQAVREIRVRFDRENPHTPDPGDISGLPLIGPATEPWAVGRKTSGAARQPATAYGEICRRFPKLFDCEQLRVTPEDYELARAVNGRMRDNIQVGEVWPLSWHQLRRTGAVNMMSLGLVQEQDLTYQLKHLNRQMSRYYANGYRQLQAELDNHASGVYVTESYRVLGLKAAKMLSSDFVSPHGEKRKAQILEVITRAGHEERIAMAMNGDIIYHETFLGGCAKPGSPCPLGGISNISSCMGFDDEKPCEYVMLEKTKRPVIAELADLLKKQMLLDTEGTPLHESCRKQKESADRALEVIDAIE